MPTPDTPIKPTLRIVSSWTIEATTPALPTGATSIKMQWRKRGNLSWTETGPFTPGQKIPYSPGPHGPATLEVQAIAISSDASRSYSDSAFATTQPDGVAPVLLSRNSDGTTIVVRVTHPTFVVVDDRYDVSWFTGSAIGTWSTRTSVNIEIVGLTPGTTYSIFNHSHDQYYADCSSLILAYKADPPQPGDGGPGEGGCLRG